MHALILAKPWASYQIRKIVGCVGTGNAGNVFPVTDFKGNHQLAIPACIAARASRAVMHAGIASLQWRGKRSRHSRRMRNPQFYVSGKRPMSVTVSVRFQHVSIHFLDRLLAAYPLCNLHRHVRVLLNSGALASWDSWEENAGDDHRAGGVEIVSRWPCVKGIHRWLVVSLQNGPD